MLMCDSYTSAIFIYSPHRGQKSQIAQIILSSFNSNLRSCQLSVSDSRTFRIWGPTIRWTCPWWRIRLVTIGSMNLNYVLYASLDRSMAYFPDRISRQYGTIQRVPRIHNFESGLMTLHLLTNLANRWRSRNTRYLGEGVMQDTVTPEYGTGFLPHDDVKFCKDRCLMVALIEINVVIAFSVFF
ncbi:hypothetical protein JCGZ_06003 [Jatropha curcas]|uniref:Uncharacterized protein n=1 Tax=Jatropha curcas TaxID=180498 RepID=A0A067J9K2_JATCU|nr:hypothetical protein JCGZ_06003 [Jatropha curcas]